MLGLLRNQKFWFAVWALLQALLLGALGAPLLVVAALEALVLALIASTLIEGDVKGLASRRVLMAAVGLVAALLGWAGLAESIWLPLEGFAIALIEVLAIADRVEGRHAG